MLIPPSNSVGSSAQLVTGKKATNRVFGRLAFILFLRKILHRKRTMCNLSGATPRDLGNLSHNIHIFFLWSSMPLHTWLTLQPLGSKRRRVHLLLFQILNQDKLIRYAGASTARLSNKRILEVKELKSWGGEPTADTICLSLQAAAPPEIRNLKSAGRNVI